MCRIDDCDGWVSFGNFERRARKSHKCCDCGREIKTGETYNYGKGLMDGYYFMDAKTCAQCQAAAGWLTAVCNGYLYEGIGEELREHWDEEWQFRCLALGKLCIGHRRRWKDIPPLQVDAWMREAVAHAKKQLAHVS